MEHNFLTSARTGKNILYILTGLIIGFSFGSGGSLERIDWIIIIVGIGFFGIEFGIYINALFGWVKDSFNKKNKERKQ